MKENKKPTPWYVRIFGGLIVWIILMELVGSLFLMVYHTPHLGWVQIFLYVLCAFFALVVTWLSFFGIWQRQGGENG